MAIPRTSPSSNTDSTFIAPIRSTNPGTSAASPSEPATSALSDHIQASHRKYNDTEFELESSYPETQNQKPEDAHNDKVTFPLPTLRFEVRTLAHPGVSKFFSSCPDPSAVLISAVQNVLHHLYLHPSELQLHSPPTRSVTLILRPMDGVAYTNGTELDNDHKEIHFSLDYIQKYANPDLLAREITGVLTHELVHCYQWDAKGTCPGGLVEGIADWVRLQCGLAPPHWKRDITEGGWDKGYSQTGYFLDYLEVRFGKGTVRLINEKLRLHKYEAKPFWTELLDWPVEQLWQDYVESFKNEKKTR